MSLNQHIAYVFYRLEFIADSDADAVVSVVVITAVCSLVLSVQGSENFGGFHAAMRSCNREMLIHSGRLPYSSTRSTSSMSLISRLMSSA